MNEIPRNAEYEKAFRKMRRRKGLRRWLNRGGCLIMFAVWFIFMLMPCFFVTLVTQKEIVVSRSDVPEHEIRVFILEESDSRGFGLSMGRVAEGDVDGESVCIKTDTNYLMWQGEGEAVSYCDCYEKSGDAWLLTQIGDADCKPIEFDFDSQE